jgi:hypothetical protein
MRFIIQTVLVAAVTSKVQHELKRQKFVSTPFEKFDPSVKTISYKNKTFSSKLTEV